MLRPDPDQMVFGLAGAAAGLVFFGVFGAAAQTCGWPAASKPVRAMNKQVREIRFMMYSVSMIGKGISLIAAATNTR